MKTKSKPFSRSAFTRRSFLAGAGAAAAGLSFGPRLARAAEEPKLNFDNWDTYSGETTLADFAKASGIEVNMDLFADNDELFAKLREGNPGYDVIVPTNDYAERMIAAGMLEKLDHARLPNMVNLDPVFTDAEFDPGRQYTMPYMWGTIGVGYRKSKVDEVPDSWKWLYDSDKYSGRISMLGDGGTLVQMGLKFLGVSLNSTDPVLIKQVEDLLIAQKKHIKVYAEDNGQDLLASGEVDICMEWNGDILQVMAEDDDIGFVLPKEGGLLWQDTLAIPKGAPHPENAHAFINYLHDAEAAALIAEFIQYATSNAAARKLVSVEYNENPAIFPPPESVKVCETSTYKGEDYNRLIDETWTRIQAA
ncbi:MAG: ABC transporter substrate-binding protein [Gammaproteobacteria bacterium]